MRGDKAYSNGSPVGATASACQSARRQSGPEQLLGDRRRFSIEESSQNPELCHSGAANVKDPRAETATQRLGILSLTMVNTASRPWSSRGTRAAQTVTGELAIVNSRALSGHLLPPWHRQDHTRGAP